MSVSIYQIVWKIKIDDTLGQMRISSENIFFFKNDFLQI